MNQYLPILFKAFILNVHDIKETVGCKTKKIGECVRYC